MAFLRARLRKRIIVGCIILIPYLIYFSNWKFTYETKVEVSRNYLQGVKYEDYYIKADGYYKFSSQTVGLIIGNNRSDYRSQQMESSLLYEFSPDIEENVRNLFINENGTNDQLEFHVISPAILPYKGNIMVVARVWLNYERRRSVDRLNEKNQWMDNYLYSQMFDGKMHPISPGKLLGIPAPVQYKMNAGCSDARLFKWMGSLMISFYMTIRDNKSIDIGQLYLLDYEHNIIRKPKIVNHTIARIDSNWAPLIINESLHFVYTMDPLRILKCTREENMDIICHFIMSIDTALVEYPFHRRTDFLRGGSPFLPYKESYFISVTHSTLTYITDDQEWPHPIYGAHIVLLKVYPFRIIYVSERLKIHPRIYDKIPIVRNKYILHPFLYPIGLIIEDSNTIDIGIHINDYRAFIIRLTGIENVLDEAIMIDSGNNGYKETAQPRSIQQFVKHSLQKSHFNQTWRIEEENTKQNIS
ncbi:unnamed protein product [Owenia fusiformis]|uniref:Uncharacterized protein n=1 Tax=Owenia fusiformis TaxID=6347 RepID=A0A8J1XXJ8_OWEFU|nr:unnamed protein product [Owenia fusiformis]